MTSAVPVATGASGDADEQPRPGVRGSHPAGQPQRLTSPIHRLEGMIIRSIAFHRLGMTSNSADLLRRAVNQTTNLGCFLPLASAPRHDLRAMAEVVPAAERLLQDPVFASTADIYPARVALVSLTDRELSILRMLADGLQPRDIASHLYVSPSTVKTQTQSLYRKLNATSRSQALHAARELQILSPGTQ